MCATKPFKPGKPDVSVIQRGTRVPLTDQLNDILRRELKKFKPGDRFFTDREVCRKYGVSPPVTRTVLARLAAEGLIRREMSRGTFVETPRAAVAVGTVRRLAVFCPMDGYCPHSAAVRGIETVCRAAGYDVLIHPNAQSGGAVDLSVMSEAVAAALKGADGAIWVGSILEELKKWPAAPAAMARRLVCVNLYAPTGQITSVVRDDAASAFALAGHLIECGYRRIGYIGGLAQRTSAVMRHAGFERAMREHGLDLNAPWIVPFSAGMREDAGHAVALGLIKNKKMPDAMICVTDRMAASMTADLLAAGYRVPDDVAVAGFDNAPASEQCRPPLTSVDPRFAETGRLAAKLLLDQLNGHAPTGTLHWMPGRLVVRDSTELNGCKGKIRSSTETAKQMVYSENHGEK